MREQWFVNWEWKREKREKRDVIIQCGIYEEVVDKPYLHAYCLMSEYSG